MQQIPVFTDDPGWHGRRLQQAFAARGYQAVFISLKDCFFDLSGAKPQVVLPGLASLPPAVFVRGVPGGTLQQVIVRLNILHALQQLGVLVYNNTRAIERTVDKCMTSFLLHHHQLSTPATWVCESRHHAQEIIARETQQQDLVIKPLFGSQGKGVRKLNALSPIPVPMEEHVDGLYYLQRYIDSGEGAWHDHRVFVIRHQAVGAMVRHGNTWVNNIALGGRCEALEHDAEITRLAEEASVVLGMDYCGVDIIRDQAGRLYVLEVNSIPAWKGLQGVVQVDVAQALVDDFLSLLKA
jgi:tetrahydromethanopterin:alpha-L-glutamate ligase